MFILAWIVFFVAFVVALVLWQVNKKKDVTKAKKYKTQTLIYFILSLVCLVGVVLFTPSASTGASVSTASSAASESAADVVIYEDDTFKVTYQGLVEYPSISDTVYIVAQIENKTDGEITVYPDKVSVNDMSLTLMSGMPATMQGGKKFNQSWFFTYANADIQSLDDVKTIDMAFRVDDENFSTIDETDIVTITVE